MVLNKNVWKLLGTASSLYEAFIDFIYNNNVIFLQRTY